jgi:hypothetical protein
MKKILLLALFAAGGSLFAQNTAALCENAYSLCGALGEPFANTTDAPSASAESAENYGCLNTYPNPAWFYLPISQAGDLTFTMTQTSTEGVGIDVDYICWGPFNTMDGVCGPENLNPTTQVGCSYSTASVEQFTLQNATVGSYYVILITNFSNQPGTIKVENTGGGGANPEGALNCSGINLNAFLDANANGTQDAGEMGFPYGNFIYNINPDGNVHNVTSFNGDYTIYDENLANTYNVSYELPAQYSGYYSVTTSSYNNVAVESANNVVTYNFPVVQTNTYQDLSVNVISGQPVPGFTYVYYITYTNAGPQAIPSGTVVFDITPGYSISTVSQAGTPVVVNATATGFDYTFANLAPFETVTLAVTVQVPVIPDVALGDEVTAVVAITPLDGDAMPDDNTSTNVQVVVGSYDPNDIMESRGREIEINTFDDADYLYYTIRFQNTGTYEARNAKIEDLLGTQFDYSTVQVLRSSHNFTMDRQNNHLSWTFNNIHLPAAQDNEEGSHGYVYFKVKPLPGYEVGDIIPNSADIYFDFNPAIVTNTFESEFVDAAMGTKNININGFTMYPNPAKGLVNITAAGNDTIAAIKIYDVTGKTIYTNKLNGVSAVVNSSAFESGTYFVEVLSGNNAKIVKKLLIE